MVGVEAAGQQQGRGSSTGREGEGALACSGVPRTSRVGTRSVSSYVSSPMVGMKSTSTRTGGLPTPRCAFAVSMFLSLLVSERMVVICTLDTCSSGRPFAKPSIPAITLARLTSAGQSRRHRLRSRSSGVFPSSRSRTYPPLTSSCAGRRCSLRKASTKERMSFSRCGTFSTSEAGSTEPWAKDSTAARDGQRHGERHSFAQGRKTGRAARTVHSRPTPLRPVPGAVQSQTVA